MSCGAWIAIILGSIYLIVLTVFSIFQRRYPDENLYKPRCCNSGFILEGIKLILGLLNFISPSRFISWNIKDKFGSKPAYWFVDFWVSGWLVTILYIFLNNVFWHFNCLNILIGSGWVVWVIGYRLIEIAQSWFSQFVVGGVPDKWHPINIYRSLVLVFMGYIEIVFAYAILAYNYKGSFEGITSLRKAFIYSFGNAVTIGWYNDIQLSGTTSYIIFSTQLILVLIFLTAVVQQILNYDRTKP
ncbi:hypothetical protein KA005_19855 [bacterium]|nr:hypothetical protein [bacterium]